MSFIDAKGLGVPDKTAIGPNVNQAESQAISDGAIGQLRPYENLPSDAGVIDGADLLDRILEFFTRFLDLPDHAAVSMALWAGHTHLMVSDTTPRLAFISAEPACGKTLAMRLMTLLCPRSLGPISGTAASLIRALDVPKRRPTYFLDALQKKFGLKAKGDEDLSDFIERGHQADGFILRSEQVNKEWYNVKKNVFAAMALAVTGNILPEAILSMSVPIRMRKRLPGKIVDSYRRRDHQHLGHALRDGLAAWVGQNRETAALYRPILPEGITDRDADVWEPLIVVADLAGGHWPDLARQAAIASVDSAKVNDKPSLGVRLLVDIRTCFSDDKDRVPSGELVTKLLAIEDAPWRDLGFRKMLDQYVLAEMLREYGISPHSIRMPNGKTPKGYYRSDFEDAWERYLPQPESAATSATSETIQENVDITMTSSVADDFSSSPPSQRGGNDGGVAEPES